MQRNPWAGEHPDLFEGASRRYVPMSALSKKQILALPTDSFSDEEWGELSRADQLRIMVRDVVKCMEEECATSDELDDRAAQWEERVPFHIARELWRAERVAVQDLDVLTLLLETGFDADEMPNEYLQAAINKNPTSKWLKELLQLLIDHFEDPGHDHILMMGESELDYAFQDPEMLLNQVERFHPDELEDLKEEFGAAPEDDLQEALSEAFGSMDNYEEWSTGDWDPYYSRTVVHVPVSDSLYYEFRGDELEKLQSLSPSIIEIIVDGLSDSYDIISAQDVKEAADSKYHTLEKEFYDPLWEITGNPDWDLIRQSVAEQLGDFDEGEEPEPPEVVAELGDGFVLVDLEERHLREESKELGHCVSRRDMGYRDALRGGEIKLLSIRTAKGRPKFTIEAQLGPHDWIDEIVQVKGKANRLPGWQAGKTGEGKVKAFEVEMVAKAIKKLGKDPWSVRDLRPGLEAVHGRKPNAYAPERTFDEPYRRN